LGRYLEDDDEDDIDYDDDSEEDMDDGSEDGSDDSEFWSDDSEYWAEDNEFFALDSELCRTGGMKVAMITEGSRRSMRCRKHMEVARIKTHDVTW
jgi:hypothetical protein